MRVELGAHVRTSDGKDVGKIDKLVFDPQSGEVKAAVIRKGFILTEDVEVPLSALETTAAGEVRLACTADQVNGLPRFSEANYGTPPADWAPPYGYAAGGFVWPVAWAPGYRAAAPLPSGRAPSTVERELDAMVRQQDFENAVVDEGSDVVSQDGEKVGEVERITFDPATGRALSFIVRKGFLFTEDFELPAETIASLDDGVVYLNADKEQVSTYRQRSE